MVSSLDIAEHFQKRHDNILRTIRNLLIDCDEEFRALNFEECSKINRLANGKKETFFKIARDGFALLVMGFTGKTALADLVDLERKLMPTREIK